MNRRGCALLARSSSRCGTDGEACVVPASNASMRDLRLLTMDLLSSVGEVIHLWMPTIESPHLLILSVGLGRTHNGSSHGEECSGGWGCVKPRLRSELKQLIR